MTPRYPSIEVNLKTSKKAPIPTVRLHMCWAGVSKAIQREFVQEALGAGCPTELKSVIRRWVVIHHDAP